MRAPFLNAGLDVGLDAGLVAGLVASAALLLVAPSAAQPALQEERSAEEALELLASGDEAARAALEQLEALGPRAAELALQGFDGAGPAGRRERAELVAERGSLDVLEAVLARRADPDARVRLAWMRYVGRSAHGEERAPERIAALEDAARADHSRAVRREAIQGLLRSGLPGAVEALEQLLADGGIDEQREAARALCELPAARPRLVARVQAELGARDPARRLEAGSLALLVAAYGEALAEMPSGGELSAERAPLFAAVAAPAPPLRAAALESFDRLVARLAERQEVERLERLFELFARDGWSPPELAYRRAVLALSTSARPTAALAAADELVERFGGGQDALSATWRCYGLHLRAVARLCTGEPDAAQADFRAALTVLARLAAEREDLRPSIAAAREAFPRAPVGGSVLVDRIHLMATLELWLAFAELLRGARPEDAVVLEHARRAHVHLLEAQLAELRSDANLPGGGWDAALDHGLAPRRLLLSNPEWRTPGSDPLALALGLARAIAAVAPQEMPGFDAAPAAGELGDPLLDPERRTLLRQILDGEIDRLERELGALFLGGPRDPLLLRVRLQERRQVKRGLQGRLAELSPDPSPQELRAACAALLDLRTPSAHVLDLAEDLRAEGRAAEARELAASALSRLRAGLTGANNVWAEWTSAELELAIASSLMDENLPQDAEAAGLKAVERLEALENTILRWREQSGEDAELLAQTAAYQRHTRARLASALLSLAVNANVRLGDRERALGYFERAYALDQSDSMRVLLACYRARSGREAEALAILSGVQPTPRVYYNLACTYALLGRPEEALDWLQREFAENHRSAGSRRRQQEWARGDPDLAALRELPRFERLLAD